MSLAICMKCGGIKFGSLGPCDKCGFEPKTIDDSAYSMALTDHYFPSSQLREIGSQIASGRRPIFDPAFIAELVTALSSVQRQNHNSANAQQGSNARKLQATLVAKCITHETIELVSEDSSSIAVLEVSFATVLVVAKSL